MTTSSFAFDRPARAILLSLAAGLVFVGCHSGEKGSTQPAPETAAAVSGDSATPVDQDDWSKIGYRLDWVGFPFPGMQAGAKVTFVNAYADVIVMQESGSTLSLLESSNGQTRWSTQLAGPLTKFVGINRDPLNPSTFLISSESEMFTVSGASGGLIARDRYSRVVNTRPIIENGVAIVGCSTGEVMGHVIGRGVKAWGFVSTGAIRANPVEVGDAVGVVSQSGDVMFFARGGGLVGRGRVYEGLDNDPVAENGLMFVAGRDRSVWAFDTAGNQTWRYRTSSALSIQPTAHNGTLYVAIPGEGLTAFEETTGKIRWQNPTVLGTVVGTRAGRLLVHSTDSLALLNPNTGDIVDQIAIPGIVKLATDQFDDGAVFAVSSKGSVAKLRAR